MIFLHAVVAATIAGQAAAQSRAIGKPATPHELPKPATFVDRLLGIAFWFLVFSPCILVASTIGLLFVAAAKVIFAAQGIPFP